MDDLFADSPLVDLSRLRPAAAKTPANDTESGLLFAPESVTAPRAAVTDPEELLDGLNPQQRQAVLHQGGPMLVVAGAGSGKTRVLTRRIAYVLASKRATPAEILAITFTNKAAAEMRERITELIGDVAGRMWIGTFHSICVRILRANAKALGFKSSFTIYDAADSQRLLTIISQEQNLDTRRFGPKFLSSQISKLKDELVDPETFAGQVSQGLNDDGTQIVSSDIADVVSTVYSEYQRRLLQANAMDFDDLIMTTVNLLQAFPDIAEHYRRRFRHILVDEYQDTNHAQYVLVRELGGVDTTAEVPPAEITVVGDADQSIYAFRGATIRNIEEFEADYPSATTVLLEQNYRSTGNILAAANAVISKNPGRKAKNLWSDAGPGELLVGYVADSEYDEAQFVADEIDRLTDEGHSWNDFAVFYRANAQSRALEEVLIRVGIAYRVVGGTKFYDRKEIKDALAYLRVLVNPDDDVSMRRIFNVPKRGLGDRAEAAISVFAQQERISFGAAVSRSAEIVGLGPRAVKPLAQFNELLGGLRDFAATGAGAGQVLAEVLERSGYLEQLRGSLDPTEQVRVENLDELYSVASEFAEGNPDAGLGGFLEATALHSATDDMAVDEDQGQVTLMTLHTAKGLEYPVVFLTGLEDGTFPHSRSLADPAEMAEERRIAYVGLTRARERLYLSRAAVRSAWGQSQHFPASRFLADIPDHLIEWRRDESEVRNTGGWGSREDSYGSDRWGSTSSWGSGGGSRYSSRKVEDDSPPPLPTAQSLRGTNKSGVLVSLDVGDRVTHDKFGLGKVVQVTGEGYNAAAGVDFGDGEVRQLLLRYHPITKL